MMIKRIMVASLMTLSMAVTVPALAGGGAMSGCPHAGHSSGQAMRGHLERMMDRLEVTDQQRADIRAILDETRPQMKALREQTKATRAKIHKQMQADVYDEAALSALADEQGAALKSKIVLRTAMMHRIHAVLSPEQRERLKEMRDARMQRHHGQSEPEQEVEQE